nr:DUF624 domain-containing protein [Alloscardovia omnicolens]
MPLITLGPSTAALYETIQSMQEGDDAHVLRHFWRIFKHRIGTNIALSLILGAFYALVTFDLWYLSHAAGGTDIAAISYGVIVALSIVVTLATVFILPRAGRSSLSIKQQFKQSLITAVRYPLISVIITAINAVPLVVAVFVPGGLAFALFF